MNHSDETRPDVDDTEDDDRYLVIRGRRWRRTDPALEADVVRALKSHLGRARSQVGRAGRLTEDSGRAPRRSGMPCRRVLWPPHPGRHRAGEGLTRDRVREVADHRSSVLDRPTRRSVG